MIDLLPGTAALAAFTAAIAAAIVAYGLATVPSAPAATAVLSTNTVFAVLAVLNQKLKAPPALPSRSPSSWVPEASTIVVDDVLAGWKAILSS